jgi:peptidoglycan/LPS O-acetylase OafA/YrhL
VNAGRIAVGLFLFIGGFLVSYVLLKADWSKISTIFMSILNRMLRILPVLLFVIMIYACLYAYIGSGVLWGIIYRTTHIRLIQILTTIVFISNYTGLPYSVAWYLYVDMQIFILSMPILYIYKRSKLKSKIILWILIIAGIAQTFIYAQINNVPELASMKSANLQGKYNGEQFIKPYTWIPTYMLGLFLGMLYT